MSIKKHLSSHSSDKQIFKKSAIYFEHPLNKADYTNKLVYNFPSTSNLENKNKNYYGNIKWFNPTHSKNVATYVLQEEKIDLTNSKDHNVEMYTMRK